MNKIRKYIYAACLCATVIFIIFNQLTYSVEYKNNELQKEIQEVNSQIEEIKLKITSEASKTEIEENNPDLKFNNNVYYLEGQEDEKE